MFLQHFIHFWTVFLFIKSPPSSTYLTKAVAGASMRVKPIRVHGLLFLLSSSKYFCFYSLKANKYKSKIDFTFAIRMLLNRRQRRWPHLWLFKNIIWTRSPFILKIRECGLFGSALSCPSRKQPRFELSKQKSAFSRQNIFDIKGLFIFEVRWSDINGNL